MKKNATQPKQIKWFEVWVEVVKFGLESTSFQMIGLRTVDRSAIDYIILEQIKRMKAIG